MTKLTVEDLHATLEDERHLGWGYATTEELNDRERRNLDVVVIEIANEQGWTKDQLFEWSNSKYGRWLSDLVYGRGWTQKQMRTELDFRQYVTLNGLDL